LASNLMLSFSRTLSISTAMLSAATESCYLITIETILKFNEVAIFTSSSV
jgi:hypothetical protein